MQSFLRAALAWLFTAVYWTLVMTVHLASGKRLPDSWLTQAIHFWGKTVLRILGIRLELQSPSPLDERQARVVIINHQSALDLVWPAAISPPSLMVIGKKEVIYVPVINLLWWALDFVRVDRSNHENAMAALKDVGREISEKKRSLVIAPEGTRTRTGRIGPFKSGAFHLARQARVPIYPVVSEGSFDLLPKHHYLPRKGVIRVRFLPPIPADRLKSIRTHDEMAALIKEVRDEMVQAQNRLGASFV